MNFVYKLPENQMWEKVPRLDMECLLVISSWVRSRSRFSRTEELSSTRGRTPIERTPSFARESGPQKWFRRQFSRQMSSHQSGEEAQLASAVAAAAAAVAITSLEDAMDQRQIRDGPWASLPRTRIKKTDITSGVASKSYAAKDSQRHENFEAPNTETNDRIPQKTIQPVPSIKRTPSMPKKRLTFSDQLPQDYTVPSIGRTPTIKKTPSSSEVAAPILASPVPPPAIPPLNIQPAVPPKLETEVDTWERKEMAKIKERYEKLNATILEWEDKKKKKARRKLETTENELANRRAKAMHKYQIEIEQIKRIADGARAQAKDKTRNEELKVKEKANRYRERAELPQPPACRCW